MIEREELKKHLKICNDTNTKNNQLDLAIQNAVGFLSWYLMYSLEYKADRVERFWKYDTHFELPFTNLVAITSVHQASDEFDTLVEYTWTKKDYLVHGVVRTKECIWPYVEITYWFWYDCGTNAINPTPDDLKTVMLSIAGKYYKNMGETSMSDIKSETVDGDSITFKDVILSELTEIEKRILSKYQKYGFSS